MKHVLFGLMIMMVPIASQAADIENGKTLHEANCMRCHDNSIYTRPNSIIHSFSSLKNRVKFCDAAAETHFNDSQLGDITAYLNDKFYKFEQP